MGGVALIGAAVVGYLMGHAGTHVAFSRPGILVVGVTVCAAGVGFLDDWIKVRHRRSLGRNKRAKLSAQVVIAVGFALLAEHWAGVNTHLSFTRWNSLGVDVGQVGWILWAVLVVVGTANARSLPARTGMIDADIGSNIICASPLTIAFRAGPPPA